jgi:hypothetical protein
MVKFQTILDTAKTQNKNILIIGSARSGTHALGSQLSVMDTSMTYLGEICTIDDREEPWNEIKTLETTSPRKLAHLVSFTSKIRLSGQISKIKQTSLIVNLRRQNKLAQFASWTYFHQTGGRNNIFWHNHLAEQTAIPPGSVTVTDDQIDQFLIEQLIDNFFVPDIVLNYEELTFDKSKIKKNQFFYDLPMMFSNLSHVKSRLENWQYTNE